MEPTRVIPLPPPPPNKYVLFLGDTHFGAHNPSNEPLREQAISQWLQQQSPQLHALVLMGDIMDFWIEYKNLIPRYGQLFSQCIKQITQQNIPVYYLQGNHDAWTNRYWSQFIGVELSRSPLCFNIGSKKIFVAHGDKLSNTHWLLHIIKYHLVESKLAHNIFKLLPPDYAFAALRSIFRLRHQLRHRLGSNKIQHTHQTLIQTLHQLQQQQAHDYYLLGHTHQAHEEKIQQATYINTGDFYTNGSYATLNAETELTLHHAPEIFD